VEFEVVRLGCDLCVAALSGTSAQLTPAVAAAAPMVWDAQ
jgi:hypothetical protein